MSVRREKITKVIMEIQDPIHDISLFSHYNRIETVLLDITRERFVFPDALFSSK